MGVVLLGAELLGAFRREPACASAIPAYEYGEPGIARDAGVNPFSRDAATSAHTSYHGGLMDTYSQAPTEVLDYQINWLPYLAVGETIVTSAWTIPSGLTDAGHSNTTTTATQWLTGGVDGTAYIILNQITTTSARTVDYSFILKIDGSSTNTLPTNATVTASSIITGALSLLSVYAPGESISAADMAEGFRRLNMMMRSWMTQPLTIPVTTRAAFALIAGKGGPGNEYTIGPGGDFDTIRPATGFLNVGLQLGGTTPPVEIPRAILTDDAWAAIQVKTLTSPLFTSLYYNPTFTTGLGSINLWPVPDNAIHKIVLYYAQQISEFSDLTTAYAFPPGYEEAIEYNLATRLSAPFSVPLGGDVAAFAVKSLAAVKRANARLTDLPQDPAITNDRRSGYNIISGQGS